MQLSKSFARFAAATAKATGSPLAFLLCVVVVVVWAASGPVFRYSDTWQLVINTGTTIVTFLMVFLIQNTQNRDGAAIQIKLDELILTSKAENDFIGIEKLTDEELEVLRSRCAREAERNRKMLEKTDAVLHSRRRGLEAKAEPAPKRAPAARKRSPARKQKRASSSGAA